jgi:hypothetical protein
MAVLIGLIQLSLALVIIGVLVIGSGIEGIAWEIAHRGPRRSSSSQASWSVLGPYGVGNRRF